jgi:hypothetical protein
LKGVHAKVVVTIKVQKLKDKLKVRPDQVQFAASGRGVRLQAGEDRIMVRVQYGQHGAPVDRQAVSSADQARSASAKAGDSRTCDGSKTRRFPLLGSCRYHSSARRIG